VAVGSSFVAGAEPFELVQPGEGALDDPADLAQSGAVGDAASGDHRLDAALPQQAAVLEVIAPVGVQASELATGAFPQAPDRWDRVQQRLEVGDIVSVPAGERDDERSSVAVNDQMVFGAGTGSVDGRGANVIPPLKARKCDPFTAQSSKSSRSARRNSVSSAACKRGYTQASVQSRNLRQAVTPELPTVSAGTSRPRHRSATRT
jgi:hypothetical protein